MKLVKSNNKTYLHISHSEWEMIGRGFERKRKLLEAKNNKLIKEAGQEAYVDWDTFRQRMESVGWLFDTSSSAHSVKIQYSRMIDPKGDPKDRANRVFYSLNPAIKFGSNDWDTKGIWKNIKGDFRKMHLGEFMNAIFAPDFKWPQAGLDSITLQPPKVQAAIQPSYQFLKVNLSQLWALLQDPKVEYQIEAPKTSETPDGQLAPEKREWQAIEEVDAQGKLIALKNGSFFAPSMDKVTVRKEI